MKISFTLWGFLQIKKCFLNYLENNVRLKPPCHIILGLAAQPHVAHVRLSSSQGSAFVAYICLGCPLQKPSLAYFNYERCTRSSYVDIFASLTSFWSHHILEHHYFSIVLALCDLTKAIVCWIILMIHNTISECKERSTRQKCPHGYCVKTVYCTTGVSRPFIVIEWHRIQ